ncbi:penicillin acylase family protein [Aquimarina litoralis]|uniref:Penicillin acylase family protein n=1 Tax=Aquimarina litoralis TaxID=584605 RepID=A0ABP3UH42_9FLAO
MKVIKTVLTLVLCIGWIFITNYKFEPINSIGPLLTYKTGLLSIPLPENEIKEIHSNKHKPKVYIDDIGIPHIYGKKNNDVAFGMGYMHAKDRYFQMEMITRTVLGEMSEVFSEETVSSDSFWTPYEFDRKSKELLEDYKKNAPEFYEYLLAYSEGVNEYLLHNKNTDPLYKIFGETPRDWKPEYSLLVTWYMSWSLTYFDQHVGLNEVLTSLSDEERDYFYPLHPKGLKTILPSNDSIKTRKKKKYLESVATTNIEENTNPLGFHTGIGSNNWVVNAIKTKNGKSILANDPHLFLTLPEAFYEVHMVSGSLAVYGFSIPGVPVIVSGHNNQVSWGITNGEWDLVDRYQLKVKNDSLYFYEDNWVPFDKKQYTIRVKGKKDKLINHKTTLHGKVIQENNKEYYAQYWYASDKSYSVKSMFEMMQSKNWDDFTSSLKDYGYPPQNFIYTDKNDNIGVVCAGKLPNRDQNYMGELLDGTQKSQMRNAIDTLWYTQNPSNNFLFSGNQQPIQNNTYFGYHGLKDDYRVERINSLLHEKNDWGIDEIQKMQSDEVDLSFFEFKELLDIYGVDNKYQELVNGLMDWNGDMKADNNQALIYELLRRGIEKEAKKFAKKYLKVNRSPSFKYFTKYLKDKEYVIANATPKNEILNKVLHSVDSILNHHHGKEWKKETYKNISTLKINNISFIPGLGVKIEDVGGNTNTINMNTKYHHPVFRAIYEMNKEEIKAYTVLAGGQSGKINSNHYKDQLELWRKGKYKQSQFVNTPDELKNIKNIIKFN